mgnify:CR=1 FL=1
MDTLKYKFSLILFSVFVIAFALQSCDEKSTATKVEKTEPTLSAVYDSYDDLAYLFN